jgi:hypothetical protein
MGAPTIQTAVRQTWPWKLWLALIVIFALGMVAFRVFKPSLECSRPELSYRDGVCIAQFDATNHADRRVVAVLRIVVGGFRPAGKGTRLFYVEYAHKVMSVTFAPLEKKSLTCELPMPSPSLRAKDARVEVESLD